MTEVEGGTEADGMLEVVNAVRVGIG